MGNFFNIALSAEVLPRAIKVALVVGTLLAAINHADALVDGTFALKNFIQVVLSYLVPYGVSTYSSVGAIQQRLLAEGADGAES